MKNLRPFQIGAIAIAVVLALGGLYTFTTFTGFGNDKEAIGTVTIWGTLPQAALDAGLDELSLTSSEKYANVSYIERPAASFSSDLANAIASGSGPDLIIISQEDLLTERGKLNVIPFDSIPQRTYTSAFLPIFQLYLTEEGTYGVPLVVDPLVLYYNRAILSSVGVTRAPSTWDAVSGLAMGVTGRDDRGTVTRSLISLGEYQNVSNARAILSLLFLQAGSTITEQLPVGVRSTLVNGGSSSFGATPAQSALSFYAQFADPAKTVYSWNRSLPESRQAFLSGDLVLYPGFASEEPYLTSANPNLSYDMAPMPQPSTNPVRIGYGLAYAFAVPKASANPLGALALSLELTAPAPMTVIAESVAMAPARQNLLTPPADNLYAPIYFSEALIATGWLSPAPYVTDAVFSAMISDIITGRLDAEGAVQKGDQSLNAVLR